MWLDDSWNQIGDLQDFTAAAEAYLRRFDSIRRHTSSVQAAQVEQGTSRKQPRHLAQNLCKSKGDTQCLHAGAIRRADAAELEAVGFLGDLIFLIFLGDMASDG